MSLSDKMVFLTGRSMGKSTHVHFIAGDKTIFLTVDDVREAVMQFYNEYLELPLGYSSLDIWKLLKKIFGEKLI